MKQILLVIFLLTGLDSNYAIADDFDSDDKRALVIFAADPNDHDILINAYGVNTDNGRFDAKSGFNLIIGKGTLLFGPHTKQYDSNSYEKVMLQEKHVRPGSYVLISANGGPRNSQKASTACFASNSKLFAVEAGKVYLVALPDAEVIKVKHNMDWSLDPQLSADELLSAYEDFIEQNDKNIDADVSVAPFEYVSFESRMKFGACRPIKSGSYEVIEP